MAGGGSVDAGGIIAGEWSLTAAAWSDRHEHVEINYVLEGELHVTSDGETRLVGAGGFVVVPAGSLARYEAPKFARMLFVYGPSSNGHVSADTAYDELPLADTDDDLP